MFFRRILRTNRDGNAALRIAGVALGWIGLGDDEDATMGREVTGGAETGDAAADDQEVAGSQSAILPSA
jgi:hypothetical protein